VLEGGMEARTVTLRRRSGWEAADMGILLWRLNWKPLLLFTGIPISLCTAAARFVPSDKLFIANIVLWWILPLIDRFALQVVSVRFFEPRSSCKRLFKGLGKTIRQGLTGDLLWRRFSPWRSARMPITVLEKQKGRQLKRRREFLSRNSLDFGFPLTLICLGLKSILGLGATVFVYVICQLFFPWLFPNFWTFLESGMNIVLIISWFNSILIESLYVCMGFGLYINSRVETEGWDIELLFKENAKKKTPLAANVPALVLAGLLVWSIPAGAEAPGPAPEGVQAELYAAGSVDENDATLLQGVFDSPDFGSSKQGWKIRFKRRDENPARRLRTFPQLQELSGLILRGFVLAALTTGLVFALRFVYKKRYFSVRRTSGGGALNRIDGTSADPRQLLEKAAALHGEGKIREGWSTCFLAFIAALSQRGIRFPGEATEYEALALVRRSPVDVSSFENFIRRWMLLAYGGKTPEEGSFTASLEACRTLVISPGGTG
jgi:hypothetical protein